MVFESRKSQPAEVDEIEIPRFLACSYGDSGSPGDCWRSSDLFGLSWSRDDLVDMF